MGLKKIIILVAVGLMVLILGSVAYNKMKVEIFQEKLFISNISKIIIDTEDKSYTITDKEKISGIVKKASKLNKLYKVENDNLDKLNMLGRQYSKMKINPKYRQLIVIYKDKIDLTLGGRFLIDNNNLIFECNGYVWNISDELLNEISNSIKSAESINIKK